MSGIGAHHATQGRTDTWITPQCIIDALGPFDLDPCAAIDQPWACARQQYNRLQDGFNREWSGRVWLNPPYGAECDKWLHRLAEHGRGTALIFARTETRMFFRHVWGRATALLFLRGRLTFCTPDGRAARRNAGGPSVLVAYGRSDAVALYYAVENTKHLDGQFIWLRDK